MTPRWLHMHAYDHVKVIAHNTLKGMQKIPAQNVVYG